MHAACDMIKLWKIIFFNFVLEIKATLFFVSLRKYHILSESIKWVLQKLFISIDLKNFPHADFGFIPWKSRGMHWRDFILQKKKLQFQPRSNLEAVEKNLEAVGISLYYTVKMQCTFLTVSYIDIISSLSTLLCIF